ncbi:MAG: flavin reductase family protein [Pseudotabrizicola sp.]|uniref:flavin reductase family protein n=1 Tax=Pseudotabrizicola sp. TaxID=2939647 RepID=UPI00271BCBF0|nr:flavin reductase family protein [Pseudotabrizicola sp.]MDO8883100.1 flavin reductase family protein [Pseudotabrizicola sp.]MDP2081893.1 flavin reductase family protein [Pseudotabrizicola sp.]MDZ7575965.1 flavin reductase family protein [Pseudotabrizicola sp.]
MTEQVFTPEGNPRAFRDALGRYATGVTVVTCTTADGPMGFTANSFAAVSLDPALVLWSPAKTSSRFEHYAQARHYSIHVLEATHAGWLPRFGRGGAGFHGLSHELNAEGVPVIHGALARFDCAQHATYDGGDHLIVVGRVLRAAYRDGAPLVFSQGGYGQFVQGG